jgi:hypothetical protein
LNQPRHRSWLRPLRRRLNPFRRNQKAAPAPAAPQHSSGGGASTVQPIDPRQTELDQLTAQIQADDFDPYSKAGKTAMLRRQDLVAEVKAAPAVEVSRMLEQQKAAKAYWTNWGKGTDPAQTIGGKSFSKADAQALFAQVEAEFDADPINQRPELQADRDSALYREFCKALRAGPKKPKPGAAATRVSGSGGAGASPITGSNKTARQRLDDGDYDLGADVERMT